MPRLEEVFIDQHIHLRLVDLRWGIDLHQANETERENLVLKVCLNEINNCKPFFIGLLGERYGWVPSEEKISEALAGEDFSYESENKSVTALEMEYVILHKKEHLARSRFYFRKPEVYQKIPENIRAAYCDIDNPQLTKEEKKLRSEKLKSLKTGILQHYNRADDMSRIRLYDSRWENNSISGLEEWGEMVFLDLKEDIQHYVSAEKGNIPETIYEIEKNRIDVFTERRISNFRGRKRLIATLCANITEPKEGCAGLFLTGESGSGKSSVTAKVLRELEHKNDFIILKNFCGQSPGSVNMNFMLRFFNNQLEEALQHPLSAYEQFISDEKLQRDFACLLEEASEKYRVVLILDAVDQMESREEISYFSWLPANWYEHIFLFVSSTDRDRKPGIGASKLVEVQMDSFSEEDAREMIVFFSKKIGKSISEPVLKKIIAHNNDSQKSYNSPLWITLCLSFLLALDQDDFKIIYQLEKEKGSQAIEVYMLQILDELPGDPGKLFISLVDRAGKYFGSDWFIEQVFSLLAFSRSGIPESVLEDLVDEEWDNLKFSNLRRWFRDFVVDYGNNRHWTISHKLSRLALQKHYRNRKDRVHGLLVQKLGKMDLHHRLVKEDYLYHLYHANMSGEMADFLVTEFEEKDRVWYVGKLSELIIEYRKNTDWFFKLAEKKRNANQRKLSFILLNFQSYVVENLKYRNEKELQIAFIEYTRNFHEELFEKNPEENWWGYILAANYEISGDYYLQINQNEEALFWYEKRLDLGKKMYQKSPTEEFKIALSVAYDKLSEVKKLNGEIKEAKELVEQKLSMSEEILSDGNNEEEGLDKLSAGKMSQADMLKREGRLDEAIALIKEAFDLRKKLVQAYPTNLIYKYNLGLTAISLNMCYSLNGESNSAIKYGEASIKIMEFIYRKEPQNQLFQTGLADVYKQLGMTIESLGDSSAATSHYERAISICKEQEAAGKTSSESKTVFASICHIYSQNRYKQGHLDDSLIYGQKSVRLYEDLYPQKFGDSVFVQGYLAALLYLSEIHKERGTMADMYACNETYREVIKTQYQQHPNDEGIAVSYAGSFFTTAEEAEIAGQNEKAIEAYLEASKIFSELSDTNPSNLNLINGLLIVQYRLGLLYESSNQRDLAAKTFSATLRLSEHLCKQSNEPGMFQRHDEFVNDIRNRGF